MVEVDFNPGNKKTEQNLQREASCDRIHIIVFSSENRKQKKINEIVSLTLIKKLKKKSFDRISGLRQLRMQIRLTMVK